MLFEMDAVAPRDRYKLLAATVVPRPIAWVVTEDGEGRRNAAPFSFFNVVSGDPPVVGFSVERRRSGAAKDTMANIAAGGQFVVCLVPFALAGAMNVTAADLPPGAEETAAAGLELRPSALVAPPRIAASPAALECETFRLVPIGAYCLVLGRVLAVQIRDDCVLDAARCHVDTAKLDLIGRMAAPDGYLRTTDRFAMPRVTAEELAARPAAPGTGA